MIGPKWAFLIGSCLDLEQCIVLRISVCTNRCLSVPVRRKLGQIHLATPIETVPPEHEQTLRASSSWLASWFIHLVDLRRGFAVSLSGITKRIISYWNWTWIRCWRHSSFLAFVQRRDSRVHYRCLLLCCVDYAMVTYSLRHPCGDLNSQNRMAALRFLCKLHSDLTVFSSPQGHRKPWVFLTWH